MRRGRGGAGAQTLLLAGAGVGLLVACSSGATTATGVGAPVSTTASAPAPSLTPSVPPTPTASASPTHSRPPSGAPAAPATTATTPNPRAPHGGGLSWQATGSAVGGVPVTYVASTAGGSVGLLWIDPTLVRFRFVPGYEVPEGSPHAAADRRPSTWVPQMVAAFNGGFQLKDHVGGYYYLGRTVTPLSNGLATMAITSDGRLAVGRWGRDLSVTPSTVAVRQDLRLIVDHGQARTSSSDGPGTWGNADGGTWTANRSAVGVRADGSVVYAYGSVVRASAIADALVAADVREATVLDMNKSWPGAFTYTHAGTRVRGRPVQPAVWHPPSVYDQPYSRDFVVALAR